MRIKGYRKVSQALKATEAWKVWYTVYLNTSQGKLFAEPYEGNMPTALFLQQYPHILYIVSTDRRWSMLQLWLAVRSKLRQHKEYKDLRRKA